MVRKTVTDFTPTEDQMKMLDALKDRPIVYDEDAPCYSDEELQTFRRLAEERKAGSRKQTITLRISSGSLNRAKSLGKGYTSILASILENVLNDPVKLRELL
ncbi:MAG: antitoxin [Lachnospiraceae bacterium]|nr:antitoxin [Lachnospiraceae bacterium]